jgi:hypothetical protein
VTDVVLAAGFATGPHPLPERDQAEVVPGWK